MEGKASHAKIVPINRLKKTEDRIIIPGGTVNNKSRPRRICLKHSRGRCRFAAGIPRSLMDFLYRATLKLNLGDSALVFSRGTVKRRGKAVMNAVAVRRLDWDLGTWVMLPRSLRCSSRIRVTVDGKAAALRTLEALALGALIKIARPGKRPWWYTGMAAAVIVNGWGALDDPSPPAVCLIETPQES